MKEQEPAPNPDDGLNMDAERLVESAKKVQALLVPVTAATFAFVVQQSKWLSKSATLIVSLSSLFAVVYFGLYPRQPVEPILDPDTVYRRGSAVGHVLAFNVEPVLAGQFVFRIVGSTAINTGDVLQFRTATCFVVDTGQVVPSNSNGQNALVYNGISCRVIGK